MSNFLVFIDEIPVAAHDAIRLLRNLCRAVHIPVILSGTNSGVQNLVGQTDIAVSRRGEPKPWVKVVTLLPKATLESFGHFVKFKPWNNLNLECSLVDFIELIQTKSDLNYSLLFNSLLNVQGFNDEDLKNLENIFRFVVKQSKTNLPGIAIISCKLLVDLVIGLKPNVRIDFKAIWKKLIAKVQSAVTKCKPKIADFDGKLASLHILTFPSKIKSKHESGVNTVKKINNHLFRFGKSNEPGIFVLNSDDAADRKFVVFRIQRDSVKRDHCYFSKFSLDFFAHMISWNSLWVDLYEDLENPTETETVVAIYRKYLTEGGSYKVYSGPVTTHFFRLELLAHWTICNASHFNVNGYTEGVVIVKEFVKNLQVVGNLEKVTFGYVNDFPPSLKSFLARVSVPYLVTPEMIDTELSNELSGLTRFGKSWRPKNKVGWDVIFNAFLDETPNNCLIECKLWEKSVGLAMIYKYYKRACDLKSSLSFLVCSNFNQSLEKVFEDVTDLDLEAECNLPDPTEEPVVPLSEEAIEVEDKNTDSPETDEPVEISKKPKLDSAAPITIDSFNQLWSQPNNQINIYTVKPILNDSFISLEYKCIKEFPNPIGVFIITQSLFQLSRRL